MRWAWSSKTAIQESIVGGAGFVLGRTMLSRGAGMPQAGATSSCICFCTAAAHFSTSASDVVVLWFTTPMFVTGILRPPGKAQLLLLALAQFPAPRQLRPKIAILGRARVVVNNAQISGRTSLSAAKTDGDLSGVRRCRQRS